MGSWSGGSSFTDLPSWGSGFNTNLPSSLTKTGGGFGKMLGPIAGIASAGASIFSGVLGNQAAKDSLRMYNATQNAAIEEARQGRNAEVAFGLGNRNTSLYTGPRLAFDEKRMAKAFPYLMAREIPRQISEGFGNAAMIKVLGARNASEAMNQTLASYPRLNLQATSFQPQKYFS